MMRSIVRHLAGVGGLIAGLLGAVHGAPQTAVIASSAALLAAEALRGTPIAETAGKSLVSLGQLLEKDGAPNPFQQPPAP